MIKNIFIALLLLFIIFGISFPAYAENSNEYEILLKDKYIKFYYLVNSQDISDFECHNDIHVAVDLLEEVLKQYPRTRTAYRMLSLISDNIRWGNDPVIRERYPKMKEQYLNNLNDPNTQTVEKLIFMVIAAHIDLELNANDREYINISDKCNRGLINMKDNCINEDYAALALIEVSKVDRFKYLKEFKEKYAKHPLIPSVESLLITQKFYENNDFFEDIQATERKYEQFKDIILPGGVSAEIGMYHYYVSIYYLMNEKEKMLQYYNLIKEKAPDYYMLSELKKLVGNTELPTLNKKK